ncbi:hypothetical protein BDQ17DRAFT_1386496 [Cyathus striatus]|nr:hypothetical protein BDQ17DRAFT_1386496 [Cyathus striatus]
MSDTVEKMEEYLASVEEYVFSSLSAMTYSLPDVHEVVNRLWIDISRYGPGMPAFPEVTIPSLGDFQVPPPPPPPPLPPSLLVRSTDWMARHPWKTTGIVVGVVGAGLLVGYGYPPLRRGRNVIRASRARAAEKATERRQVVVVLGGDHPLALPLIQGLEDKGYIVIASVSTPEAVEALERNCKGYVKALVLDPYESGTIAVFLRSLASTLSRKFPLTSTGDPYASPSALPYIQSIISLLSLASPGPPSLAPLEHVSLRNTYLPYLAATHITPLQIIQSLLPLLRTGPARSRDKGKKSIVVCLPATDVRVGLPFASIQAMSAASTLRGIEVLRREVNIAALSDKTESMRNVRVVTADIGTFNTVSGSVQAEGIYKAMEGWTASEKVTYGPAFASILQQASPSSGDVRRYGVPRQPTEVSVFVDNMVSVVSGGTYGLTIFGVGLGLGKLWNWIRGDRFSVGAGAYTYKTASYLPPILLDTLLNIPHFLIQLRNRLLITQPYRQPPVDLPPPQLPLPTHAPTPTSEADQPAEESDQDNASETSSEGDIESNSSGDGVENSWVKT